MLDYTKKDKKGAADIENIRGVNDIIEAVSTLKWQLAGILERSPIYQRLPRGRPASRRRAQLAAQSAGMEELVGNSHYKKTQGDHIKLVDEDEYIFSFSL